MNRYERAEDIADNMALPAEREAPPYHAAEECLACAHYRLTGFGPTHDGSPHCESGSIASGGKRAHCSCDSCF